MNNFTSIFLNALGQFRAWFQATGVFILAALCSYFVDNTEWTWKGFGAALAGACLTYIFTASDHKKTKTIITGSDEASK